MTSTVSPVLVLLSEFPWLWVFKSVIHVQAISRSFSLCASSQCFGLILYIPNPKDCTHQSVGLPKRHSTPALLCQPLLLWQPQVSSLQALSSPPCSETPLLFLTADEVFCLLKPTSNITPESQHGQWRNYCACIVCPFSLSFPHRQHHLLRWALSLYGIAHPRHSKNTLRAAYVLSHFDLNLGDRKSVV